MFNHKRTHDKSIILYYEQQSLYNSQVTQVIDLYTNNMHVSGTRHTKMETKSH